MRTATCLPLLGLMLTGCLGEVVEGQSGATAIRGDLSAVWRMRTLDGASTLVLDGCEFKMTYADSSRAWGVYEVDARGPTQGMLRMTVLKEGSTKIRATEHVWEFTLDPQIDLLILSPHVDNLRDRRRFGDVVWRFIKTDDPPVLGTFAENGGGPHFCRTAAADHDATLQQADCESDPAGEWDTDLATSTSHCGACGAPCSWPDGTPGVCTDGECSVDHCPQTSEGAQRVDCDGHGYNGCEVIEWTENQDCATAFDLGSVYGDIVGSPRTEKGWGDAIFRFRMMEGSTDWFQGTALRAHVTLETSNPSYELEVIAGDCETGAVQKGQLLSAGTLSAVVERADETSGDDGTLVTVRIRDTGGVAACDTWTLVVEGNW